MLRVGIPVTVMALAIAPAQRMTPRAAGTKIATAVACAADLGLGAKTRRQFCDVVVTAAGSDSITMAVPPHTGGSTLMFDLHNRFVVPSGAIDLAQAFSRQTALVAVVGADGAIIGRGAVSREFRTTADLFDRIGGGPAGGVKAVAPGPAEAIRIAIPAAVSSVGIVGVRLDQLTARAEESFNAPGRPIAVASNFRLEYRPR
jgi:hypothetical protein